MKKLVFLALLWTTIAHATPVSIRVVDSVGAPIPNAQLEIYPPDGASRNAQTDATGRAKIEVAASPLFPDYLGRVVAFAPNFGVGGGRIEKGETTISLAPAATLRGQIVDAKNQPITDVRVRLQSITPPNGSWQNAIYLFESQLAENHFTSKSDAEGKWQIAGLPEKSKIGLEISDARFVTQRAQSPIENANFTTKMRPGANVAGRIVDEAGKPVTGVAIFAQGTDSGGEGHSTATSDATGQFVLSGLSSGRYNVMADPDEKTEKLAAAQSVSAREGETISIADLKLRTGVLVRGTVRDAQTKTGLSGVLVAVYGPHRPRNSGAVANTQTEENGQFSLRVLPGENQIYLQNSPVGYVRPKELPAREIGSNGIENLVFDLQRAPEISGIVVDEKGASVAGVTLTINQNYEEFNGKSDENGIWKIIGPNAGKALLSAEGEWQVVAPKEIVVLPQGQKLRVTVKPLKIVPLRGSVKTPGGTPIENAEISLSISTLVNADGGSEVRTEQLFTDANGEFSYAKLRPEETVSVAAKKSGFVFQKGGEAKQKDGIWTVSDLILLPLSARLEGRAINSNDEPIAGARIVAPIGGAGSETVSDAQGRFVLRDLPEGEVVVLGFVGQIFGRWSGKTGATVELKLSEQPLATRDEKLGAQILDDLWRETEGKKYHFRNVLQYEFPLDMARPAWAKPEAVGPEAAYGQIFGVLQSEPKRAAEIAAAAYGTARDPLWQKRFAALAGLGLAKTEPEIAKNWLVKAREANAKINPKNGAQSDYLDSQSFLIALSGALNDEGAQRDLSELLAWAIRELPAEAENRWVLTTGSALRQATPIIALGAPQFIPTLLAEMPQNEAIEALGETIPTVAKTDLPLARKLLEQLEKMPSAEKTNGSSNQTVPYAFGLAAKPVIEILGPQDPKAAVELARRVKDEGQQGEALALAARFQSPKIAAPLWREAADLSRSATKIAQYAAQVWELNPELGEELFELAIEKLSAERFGDSSNQTAGVAFYLAPANPAHARMLIEEAWIRARLPGEQGARPEALARAMSAIDAQRAIEMARELGEDGFDARRKIAQFLLADDKARRDLPFDRWGASDNWKPGTPTGW